MAELGFPGLPETPAKLRLEKTRRFVRQPDKKRWIEQVTPLR